MGSDQLRQTAAAVAVGPAGTAVGDYTVSGGAGGGSSDNDALFLSKKAAMSYLHRKRRTYELSDGNIQQGIVCECCIHQCSLSEIRQYCTD